MKPNLQVPNHYVMEPATEKEIDLRNIFLILMRRWWVIVIFTILTTVAGYYFAERNSTPVYQYTARLMVNGGQDQIQTLLVVLRDPPIMEEVIKELGLNQSPDNLANQISASVVGSSQRVNINVIDVDPERAVAIANTTAAVFQKKGPTETNYDVQISILQQSTVLPIQISGDTSKLKIAAIIGGIIGGVGIVLLLNSLDNSLLTVQDVNKALGVPVLGSVSKINKKNTQRKKLKKQMVSIRGETIDS
ncbi:Wzz/FepE/Etk N-terminal domain-containing protein [Bacillus sp. JJ1521]|uniref:YveK family protein n=1 Tax=Bacillus sp. JJ1521 TaxID=3122957 RepID=UPI002FFFB660